MHIAVKSLLAVFAVFAVFSPLAANTASADVSINYDACGFRSISWAPIAGATTYRVERRECDGCPGAWRLLAETASTQTSDMDEPALEYRVRAFGEAGLLLGTQGGGGDGMIVQRLALTAASSTLPEMACGTQLRVSVRASNSSQHGPTTYEWRKNGDLLTVTQTPSVSVTVDESMSGAVLSVTATDGCGIAALNWAPFKIQAMPPGGLLTWTALQHEQYYRSSQGGCVDCYTCCGGGPPGCDCSSCCQSNTTESRIVHTPCNPSGLSSGGAAVSASASSYNFSNTHGGYFYWDTQESRESWVIAGTMRARATIRVQYSISASDNCAAGASVTQADVELWSIAAASAGPGLTTIELNQGPFEVRVSAGNCFGSGPVSESASIHMDLQVLPPASDCNSNQLPDESEISSGTSADRDGNLVPDECQTVAVPGDYGTIQAAIDAAPADEMRIVSVAAGTYAGPIAFNGKPVVVRGAGAGQTVISGASGQSLSVVRFAGGEPAIAALERVTVRGGTTGTPFPGAPQFLCGGGIFGKDSAASVRDCVIEQNTAAFGGGAYLFNHAGRVERCMVRGNTATDDGGGMQLYGGSTEVVDSAVEQNSAVHRGAGLHLVQGTPTILRTTIRGNQCTAGTAGGISWVPGGAASALLFLDDATVSGNSASNQGGIGVVTDDSGIVKLRLRGTTVCGNAPAPQVSGAYTDLGGNTICNCPADINADGVANGADLGRLLFDWGPCAGSACQSDLDGSGTVDGADLGALLAAWGPCAP